MAVLNKSQVWNGRTGVWSGQLELGFSASFAGRGIQSMGQLGPFLWCLGCGVSVTLRLHAYRCDLLSDATNARVQAIALKQLEFLVDALLDD